MANSVRQRFRTAVEGPDPVFAPLCLDPLNARLLESLGFDAGIARLEAYRDAGADILMAFCRSADLQAVGDHFDTPLSTITGLDHHTPDEWRGFGWQLIIDAFTAQALAITGARSAYEQFLATGSTGVEIDGMGLHGELVELCGLEPMLDIERATTERQA